MLLRYGSLGGRTRPMALRSPDELRGQAFIGISDVAPVLRSVIGDYLKRSGIEILPTPEIDNFMMGRRRRGLSHAL
jgi:hypothetical protein